MSNYAENVALLQDKVANHAFTFLPAVWTRPFQT